MHAGITDGATFSMSAATGARLAHACHSCCPQVTGMPVVTVTVGPGTFLMTILVMTLGGAWMVLVTVTVAAGFRMAVAVAALLATSARARNVTTHLGLMTRSPSTP